MRSKTEEADIYQREHAAQLCERYRCRYHLMPPYGWMNDPNGAIYAFGKYHIFYQYNPFSADWGPTYWGHFTSDDLVFWHLEKTALAPDAAYDACGCYSGSCALFGGKLYALYTGAAEGAQTQCAAVSEDGVHFAKCEKNPLIDGEMLPAGANGAQFRDPSVFRRGDRFYLIAVSEDEGGGTRFILYTSGDLLTWELCGTIYRDDFSAMTECPSYFRLGDADAVLCSPQGIVGGAFGKDSNLLLLGSMDWGRYRYIVERSQKIDHGFDFYAGQVFQAADGRNLLFGWLRPYEYHERYKEDGWAGALTLPREITEKEGEIFVRPARELEKLRQDMREIADFSVCGEIALSDWKGKFSELEFDVDLKNASVFAVRFFQNGERYCELRYERESGTLFFDRTHCGTQLRQPYEPYVRTCAVGRTETLSVRLYLDNTVAEAFVQGGRYALSGYCLIEGGDGVSLYSEGDCLLRRAVRYEMKSIYQKQEFPGEE